MSFILTYNSLVTGITNYLERMDSFTTNEMDTWIKFAHERIARDSNTLLFEVYITQQFQPNVPVIAKPTRWENTITFNYGNGPTTTINLPFNPLTTTNLSNVVNVTTPSTANLANGNLVTISGISSPGVNGITAPQLNISAPITVVDGINYTYVANGTATAAGAGGGNLVTYSTTTNDQRNDILLRTYEFCRSYWPDDTKTAPPVYYADYGYNNWLISPTPDQAYPFELGYLETPQVIDINIQTNYLTQFMPEVLFKAVLLEAMIGLKNYEYIAPLESDYVKVISSWNSKDKYKKTDRYTQREAD